MLPDQEHSAIVQKSLVKSSVIPEMLREFPDSACLQCTTHDIKEIPCQIGSMCLLSQPVPGSWFPGPGLRSGPGGPPVPAPWPAPCGLTAHRSPQGLGKTHFPPAGTWRPGTNSQKKNPKQ